MTNFKNFAALLFLATIVSTLSAETHCPGNVASVSIRFGARHQMIVPVSINHAGPFSFLLDTGTQMTMIDPTLAAALDLKTTGKGEVSSVGARADIASLAQVDLVQAGARSVANQKMLVYDLRNLQAPGIDIQGVLGEDFLEHFDMLIDNAHGELCLDDSAAMRGEIKGSHIPLMTTAQAADGSPLPKSLIVAARLFDGMRPVRLKLDSGASVSFLYDTAEYMALGLFRGAPLQGGGVNKSQQKFMALPPQDMKIGSIKMAKVVFITLAGAQRSARTAGFDGLLALGLFRRVFVCHADHFAVLDPF
jgi:aspartyl protease